MAKSHHSKGGTLKLKSQHLCSIISPAFLTKYHFSSPSLSLSFLKI